jgi:DNA replication and repair protein RecF
VREGGPGADQLPYWDRLLVEEGGAIVERRTAVLAELAEPLASAHGEIAPGEAELALVYDTSATPSPGETPGDAIRRRLAETADKEVWNGQTLIGPHRDDVRFLLGGRDLAVFGSRGQQRTAILALKLGELDVLARTDGVAPLLLLDDVFSELDPARRGHLVRRIRALPQTFVTTTALEDLDQVLVSESTAWRVVSGRLERLG